MNSKAQAPKGKPVEILPVTVSIRILTVNNKQMTLSVFRQLPEKKAYDDQWDPIGNWWGRVNYEFANYKGGLWIVFESEGILHKCWVYSKKFDSEEVDSEEIEAKVTKTHKRSLDSASLTMLISYLQVCGGYISLPVEIQIGAILIEYRLGVFLFSVSLQQSNEEVNVLEIVVTDGPDSSCTLVRCGHEYDIDLESKYAGFFKTTVVGKMLLLTPKYIKRREEKIKTGNFSELSVQEIALDISNRFQSIRDKSQSIRDKFQSARELSDRIYSLPQLFIAV